VKTAPNRQPFFDPRAKGRVVSVNVEQNVPCALGRKTLRERGEERFFRRTTLLAIAAALLHDDAARYDCFATFRQPALAAEELVTADGFAIRYEVGAVGGRAGARRERRLGKREQSDEKSYGGQARSQTTRIRQRADPSNIHRSCFDGHYVQTARRRRGAVATSSGLTVAGCVACRRRSRVSPMARKVR